MVCNNLYRYHLHLTDVVSAIGSAWGTPTGARFSGRIPRTWATQTWSMRLAYLRTSSNVVQYLESLILVPRSRLRSSVWSRRFYSRVGVLRSGTSNLVLLCQSRQIHGNLLWRPRRSRKWCPPPSSSKSHKYLLPVKNLVCHFLWILFNYWL